MSCFHLGYDFSKSAGANDGALVLQKKWLKFLTVTLPQFAPAEMDECLVQVRGALDALYGQSDWKIRQTAKNAGFFSSRREEYCHAARIFIDLAAQNCRENIARMEQQQAARAARTIDRAERAFGQLSPYHSEILEIMRHHPN